MKAQLVVMLKEPCPGRVKTRLGREIGHVRAAWWVRHQTARLLRRLKDPRWELLIAVSPDHTVTSPMWPADVPRIAQGRGDLGARMGRLLRGLPPGPVCIVGGDIPALTRTHARDAFAVLGDHDAVFGPADDGGFWCIGLKRTGRIPAMLFEGVRWSSPHALQDSAKSLRDLRIAYVSTLRDVDTAADLAL